MALEVTQENFEQVVLQSKKPVLLDFWTTWCSPCLMVGKSIDKLYEEMSDVVIAKINAEENKELSTKYQISSVPTILLFKDGVVVKRIEGLISYTKLKDEILLLL